MTTTKTNAQAQETNAQETTAITTQTKGNFEIAAAGQGESVRATTTDRTSTLFNALNGQGKKIKDVLGVELTITNIVVTSADVVKNFAEKDKENAEKVSKPCVHFFTDDGQHISSISTGICRATEKLFAAGLTPIEGAPIKLMFITIETKNGTAHSFMLMD
jgi:hypothetical protein